MLVKPRKMLYRDNLVDRTQPRCPFAKMLSERLQLNWFCPSVDLWIYALFHSKYTGRKQHVSCVWHILLNARTRCPHLNLTCIRATSDLIVSRCVWHFTLCNLCYNIELNQKHDIWIVSRANKTGNTINWCARVGNRHRVIGDVMKRRFEN